MTKKVGIITFHNADNYGAVLQSLALRTAIRKSGVQCEVMDYRNPCIESAYRINWRSILYGMKTWRIWRWRLTIPRLLLKIGHFRRHMIFKRDIQQYCTPASMNQMTPDVLVFGSDQIWNGGLTGNDQSYLGNIPSGFHGRKVSYAASVGFGSMKFIKDNALLLKDFHAISVREPSLKESLSKIGIDSCVTLDPTLLLTRQEWCDLFHLNLKDSTSHKPYILLYSIRNRHKADKFAQEISKKSGLSVIKIRSHETFDLNEITNFKGGCASLRKFIELFSNATIVITDSFHGTVFSIIFNKRFYSLQYGDKGDSRSMSLLHNIGLESNFVTPGAADYPLPKEYDVSFILDKLKAQSFEFLSEAITD